MESNNISKIKMELFKKEKQVFPNCIQARHQYSNKRKSSEGLILRTRRSLKPSKENAYPALSSKCIEQHSTTKVAEWLQQCEKSMSSVRMPFADLEPNIPASRNEKKQIVSKMCLRSGTPKAEVENKRVFSENYGSPTVHLSPFKRNQPTLIVHGDHKGKITKKSDEVTVDLSAYDNKSKHIEKVLSVSESSQASVDELITIEDSPETYVDKDLLACLAVERAEAALREKVTVAFEEEAKHFQNVDKPNNTVDHPETNVNNDVLDYLTVDTAEIAMQEELGHPLEDVPRQFEPLAENVGHHLNNVICRLREELTQQEAQLGRGPAFQSNCGREIMWSSRALMERLNSSGNCEHITLRSNASEKALRIKHLKGIIKNRRSLKAKVPFFKAFTKNIFITKLLAKPKRHKSIQTDAPCICTNMGSVNKDKLTEFGVTHVPFDAQSLEYTSRTSIIQEQITHFGTTKEKNKFSENLFTENSEEYVAEVAINRSEREDMKQFITVCQIKNKSKSGSPDIKNDVNNIISDPLEPKDDGEIFDTDNLAHNTSGSHTVRVLVHAPMTTSHSESDSVIEDTPERLPSTPPRPSRSPSLVFDEELSGRTPPRVTAASPTFTSPTSNISNSSSNKENYDPNTTPINDTKKMDDCKGKESSARAPLGVLFESSHIRVACSCLQPVQESLLALACRRLGWTYCHEFSSGLTHLVVAVDDDNRVQRTERYVCALAAGCWVVSYAWVVKSLTHECHQDEDGFEVLDCTGEEGPRLARTSHIKLFTGLTFHCLDSITTIRRGILEWVVEAAGGRLAETAAAEANEELVITLHEPAVGEIDNNTEVSSAHVALDYQWVVESLGRYRRLPPDPFLLHAASPHSLAHLTSLCGEI